jgi:hypothetical protein
LQKDLSRLGAQQANDHADGATFQRILTGLEKV